MQVRVAELRQLMAEAADYGSPEERALYSKMGALLTYDLTPDERRTLNQLNDVRAQQDGRLGPEQVRWARTWVDRVHGQYSSLPDQAWNAGTAGAGKVAPDHGWRDDVYMDGGEMRGPGYDR